MENSNNTRQSAASAAKTWRALTVFSALAVLVFAVLLYKAVEARFNPPPRTQARTEEPQNPFQNIASSGAIAAVSIEAPAPTPPFAQQEATILSTMTIALPPEEPAEEPAATHAPSVAEQPKEQTPPTQATEQPAKPKARKVRFVYNGNAKDSVQLSGTFISWKTTEMKRVKGKWVAELYMGPGTYRYCFIVNGIKTPDPLQPLRQGGHSLAVVR